MDQNKINNINLANHFLDSHSINWKLGLSLYNLIIQLPDQKNLSFKLISRVVELKPNLVKRLGIQDQSLKDIAQRHQEIILDDNFSINNIFDINTINTKEDFQLFVHSVFEDELSKRNFKKIGQNSKVFGFGSCFAINFINYLSNKNINATSSVLSDDINSPINNVLFLKYILKKIPSDFVNELLMLNKDIDVKKIHNSIINSSHIVLTLGSAFYLVSGHKDKKHILVPTKSSKTVISDFDNLVNALKEIIDLILDFNEKATIFLTVSPIPLKGVMGQNSAVVSNILSKSLLRSAVNFLDQKKIIYLPLYDILNSASNYSNHAFFGLDDGNSRHLNGKIIKTLMESLEKFLIK